MATKLRNVVSALKRSHAKYEESAKNDIMLALSQFPDLFPDVENFAFPNCNAMPTFRLKGVIPVIHKGASYNIPIALYLSDAHPYYAPMCYVCPTPNMMVKESKNVDKSGRIYLPYLTEWRFPGYDLAGLLQVMAISFQDNSPVFAKSSDRSRQNISNKPPNQVGYTPYPTSMPVSGVNGVMPPYPLSTNCTPQPTYQPYSSPYPSFTSQSSGSMSGTVDASHLKESLLSAVGDKIRQKLREKLETVYLELESVKETQKELENGKQKLKQYIDELNNAQTQMETTLNVYKEKKATLNSVLESCKSDSSVDIDAVIDACTPLHKQIIRCYAQDCTIDDAIYFLGKAVKQGRMSLSEYLREVRQLSRKQFVYRATLQKGRQKAGLPV
uniref:UEV domain-containing protein n=1 Tax=Syphacia muris TaxID=451379 RepID=A0A0N5AQJ1_9BILA